ncbi:MAG: hypothetical protein Ta2F_17880 [Termitinemataceae bacterium]|nr:MAG: hypothetical protein Ta2F_17880 [Termitinemataceae bacterium]
MSIKKIYDRLLFLQAILAAIPPLLFWFFGVDLLFAHKIMKMNPFSLSIETWSITPAANTLFGTSFIRAVGFNTHYTHAPATCSLWDVTEGIKPAVQFSGRTKIRRRSAAGIFICADIKIDLLISNSFCKSGGKTPSWHYFI